MPRGKVGELMPVIARVIATLQSRDFSLQGCEPNTVHSKHIQSSLDRKITEAFYQLMISSLKGRKEKRTKLF